VVSAPSVCLINSFSDSFWKFVCISWDLNQTLRRGSETGFINLYVPACISHNVARERLDKHAPAGKNTRNEEKSLVAPFSMLCISYQRLSGCLYMSLGGVKK
jgi:hypothetical protein